MIACHTDTPKDAAARATAITATVSESNDTEPVSQAPAYDRSVHDWPHRLERLPQQYFTALLARVAEHAALDGEPLDDER